MTKLPETEYVTIDDGYHIAYQTFGQDSPDLLFVRSNMNHLELQWEEPHFASFLSALGAFSRVIVHDDLGTGMSDSFPTGGIRSHEQRARDIIALLERTQSENVTLVTETAGTFRAVRFAAAYPERVSAIVLCEGMARARWAHDYPFGVTEEQINKGREAQMPTYLGNAPPAIQEWFVRYTRLSVNRGSMNVLRERFGAAERDDRDVRSIMPNLDMPALVIQHADSWNAERGRYIADLLPNARYLELPGKAYGWWFPDPGRVTAAIEEFVTGERSAAPAPSRARDVALHGRR